MGFKTLAVVNPNSANGATQKLWPKIEDEIAKNVRNFEYVFTTHQGHAIELTRAGLKEGFEMIVVVGGDGTNNEVVNGFFEKGKPINQEAIFAHITQGTGGDLRKTTGIPKDFKQAASVLATENTKPIDVGHMTLIDHDGNLVERYFINIASFGIGGDVDDRVNRSSKRFGGFVSFAWASLASILTYQNKMVHLKIDGEVIEDAKIFNCAVSNGQFFGGGMHVAPNAKIDDGIFDIILLGDFGRVETLFQMSKIYKGGHIGHPKVKCFTGKVVEATSDEEVLLDVDGEQPGKLPSTFTIIPGAINLKIR